MGTKTRDIGYAMPTSHVADKLGVLGDGCWFHHTRGGEGNSDWADNDDWVGPFLTPSDALAAGVEAHPDLGLFDLDGDGLNRQWIQVQLDREAQGILHPERTKRIPLGRSSHWEP